MKTCIIAIARLEGDYIREWVKYHLNLGFDKIFIGDNNFDEKENLDRIIELKQKILKKKTSENKMSDSILRMKSEEKISESDENIKKLNILQKTTKDNIDYIERALTILSNFGYQIRNTTDIIKLTSN